MAKKKPKLLSLSWDIDFYAHEMLDANTFMQRVHFADHIYRSWVAMNGELEQFLKSGKPEMIEEVSVEGIPISRPKSIRGRKVDKTAQLALRHRPETERDEHRLRFRDKTMAEGAAILLAEKKQLHGRDIEHLLKEGGYRSRSQFFQNVLEATFKRDGRFRNIGGNIWELKEPQFFNPNGKTVNEEDVAAAENSASANL
jgi:hypothetical protein